MSRERAGLNSFVVELVFGNFLYLRLRLQNKQVFLVIPLSLALTFAFGAS